MIEQVQECDPNKEIWDWVHQEPVVLSKLREGARAALLDEDQRAEEGAGYTAHELEEDSEEGVSEDLI